MILKTIELSNIRRFAPNQKIEFGQGATILLAPNGTGKTAIFEAIELALTDQVSRLKKSNLSPLVRDQQTQAKVTLEFDDWARTVLLDKNGDIHESVKGKLSNIFGKISKDDWPFLLRLTHLLDQRDRDWFVQLAESREAGDQLARLPLGKDAAQVNDILSSVKTNMTKTSKAADEKQEQKKKERDGWLDLLRQRDFATQFADRPLVPLADLGSRIRKLFADSNSSALSINQTSLSLLQDWRAELSIEYERTLKNLQQRIAELATAAAIPSEFELEKATLANAREQSEKCISDRKNLEDERAKTLLSQKEVIDKISEIVLLKNDVAEKVRKVQLFNEANALFLDKKKNLEDAAFEFNAASSTILSQRTLVTELRGVENLHKIFDLRRNEHIKFEKMTGEARLNFLEWKDIQVKLNLLAGSLRQAKSVMEDLQIRSREKEIAVTTRELELQHAQASFQAITATTDAIRTAVSTIASQLPMERGDCPVCQAEYEAVELHARIARVLETMNPAVALASKQLNAAQISAQTAKTEKIDIENEIKAAQAILFQIQSQQLELTTRMESIRSIPLFRDLEIDAAADVIDMRSAELHSMQEQLQRDLANAPLLKSAEDTAISVGELNAKEQQLLDLQTKHTTLVDECNLAKINMDAVSIDVNLLPSIETLSKELSELESMLADVIVNQESITAKLRNWEAALLNADAVITRINSNVQASNDILQKVQAKWLVLSLLGEPSVSTLENEIQRIKLALTNTQIAHSELIQIEKELARWSSAESYQRIQEQIESQKAERSESEYSTWLENELSLAKSSSQQKKIQKDTLDTFSNKLKIEIDNMGGSVKAVEPYWQALLKRLVREPRFSATNLDYTNKNRKSHAAVKVVLNGADVPVADIASEAQMTDIQLSFMLSMALVHSWSPWKALLLDDPTQHHDLVHAASVFDVLRDYIVDHGFQVVIATHDALQARFFLRKLQNDGIDARLWSLHPGENGVQTKELLHTTYE